MDSATGFLYANGDSLLYRGVVWDSRFTVVGDAYRVDSVSPGPLYGLPKSPRYFVGNDNGTVGGAFTNDGLLMTTTRVLTEAWFGQNEYYGYGGGADQVTVHALQGSTVIGSVTLDLPDDALGEPEVMRKTDTSSFLSLTGITGYRIDRRTQGLYADNWVADNFVFQSAVPEAATAWLWLCGLAALRWRPRSA